MELNPSTIEKISQLMPVAGADRGLDPRFPSVTNVLDPKTLE
jgi:hypothetical protein